MLEAVFGRDEILENRRIIHALMIIARRQFQNEMQMYDIKEILWGRTESPFTHIFDLIFNS